MTEAKNLVREFWDAAACGEHLYLEAPSAQGFQKHAELRYTLEPYIRDFAGFETTAGCDVLEIGVGLGADHQRFAESGARLIGIDLTPRALELTGLRFKTLNLPSDLRLGDCERLEFADECFDLVYSWGVIHHSPDTPRAVHEIFRVLRPGGVARVMVYNKYSLVGLMLWLRYALVAGKPFTSLETVYSRHLESPGTKAYTRAGALALFADFEDVKIDTQLTHGDLLTSQAGQRHGGRLLEIARRVWPRWLFRRVCQRNGLFMLIEAKKPR